MYSYRDITVHSGISRSAQTGMIVVSRLVLAHGPLRTGVILAVRLLLLAVVSRVPKGALTSVPLRQVDTCRPVVARLRRALVDVDLASSPGEPCRTVALNSVTSGSAETSMLANVVSAGHGFAGFPSCRTCTIRVHARGTLDASRGPVLRLEEVFGTLSARS